MAFDPARLEQAKASRKPAFDPGKLEARKAAKEPSLPQQALQVAPQAAKSAILAPIQATKALLTDPTKVAAETPILPLGGLALAGPAGGAVGEGLRQIADIARGGEAPSVEESASKMALASLAPSAGRAAKTGGNIVRSIFTQPVQKARGKSLELLEKRGLKDIEPIIFNKNEREAAVEYAKTQAKLASQKALNSRQLQEARATLKDILDNKIVSATSPTGQIVSRAKDAVTKAFRAAEPAVGRAFDATQRAERAEAVRRSIAGLLPRIPLVGPALKQTGRILQTARQL